MAEKTNVPEIRFAGFTDPWEQRKLGDVANIKTGDSDLQDAVPNGLYPFFVRSDKVERSNRYLFDGEAILVPGEGRLGEIFHYINGKFDYHQRVYKISNFVDVDAKFAMYSMMYGFKKHALENTAKATVDSIRLPTLTEFKFRVPCRDEQYQINVFFSRLDNLITLHQRKYDKLCAVKKSMLDKMFPKPGEIEPEIRFAGFTDPWEQRKFSDLADRISIQSSDSDLPQVEYEDIIPGEGTLNKELRDKEGGKTGIKFYAGDVLYGKLRPYLMNYLYPQFNGVAVGDFWVLRAAECDSSFLYRLVQTGSFQRLANVSSGSKMPRADWNLISQSFFAVPANHAEQKAIAKSLADLDNLITLHQREPRFADTG